MWDAVGKREGQGSVCLWALTAPTCGNAIWLPRRRFQARANSLCLKMCRCINKYVSRSSRMLHQAACCPTTDTHNDLMADPSSARTPPQDGVRKVIAHDQGQSSAATAASVGFRAASYRHRADSTDFAVGSTFTVRVEWPGDERDEPVMLCGDFNSWRAGLQMQRLPCGTYGASLSRRWC